MKKLLALIAAMTIALTTLSGCVSLDYVGVSSARINEAGELVLTYSDGTEQNLGVVKGTDGEDGADGKDGTDGTDGKNGEKGQDGKDGPVGADGEDGVITIEPSENTVGLATSKGLISSVAIIAGFTETSYYGTSSFSSAGSGVIYELDRASGDAFIITNYHVVYSADSNEGTSENITVYLYGSELNTQAIEAEYVGGSMLYDIAVLKISDSEILRRSDAIPVVADTDGISVGDTAIAVGNPENMGISASVGIIGVDSEYITMTGADDITEVNLRVMRIDTAVNSGNSGGGLFNSAGELIGIVNAKIADESVENIAYAIPVNIAVSVADSIIDYCYGSDTQKTPRKALIGVQIGISDSKAEYDEATGKIILTETVGISSVETDGLANGKLVKGDILKTATLDGETVSITRQFHLIDLMLKARAGDTLTLTVLRGSEEISVEIILTEACLTDC
ncbi:MAG: trypsin-like peptidase domain-containing protein [Clostridia bacterium]|nr:trypsin-like peptidase domain-containing protein [Clostridia bacterium]